MSSAHEPDAGHDGDLGPGAAAARPHAPGGGVQEALGSANGSVSADGPDLVEGAAAPPPASFRSSLQRLNPHTNLDLAAVLRDVDAAVAGSPPLATVLSHFPAAKRPSTSQVFAGFVMVVRSVKLIQQDPGQGKTHSIAVACGLALSSGWRHVHVAVPNGAMVDQLCTDLMMLQPQLNVVAHGGLQHSSTDAGACQAEVLVSTMQCLRALPLHEPDRFPKAADVLFIIDEVDKEGLDNCGDRTLLTSLMSSTENLLPVAAFALQVWHRTPTTTAALGNAKVAALQELRRYGTSAEAKERLCLPPSLRPCAEMCAPLYIDAAAAVDGLQTDNDIVETAGPIRRVDRDDSGAVQTNHVMANLQQNMADMKHNRAVTADAPAGRFMSTATLLKKFYGAVVGISGTVGTEHEQDQMLSLMSSANAPVPPRSTAFIVLPRDTDNRRIVHAPVALPHDDAVFAEVVSIVAAAAANGRAAIVFVKSIAAADKAIARLEAAAGIRKGDVHRFARDDTDKCVADLGPGEVLVTTNLLQRGKNVRPRGEMPDGIVAVDTFLGTNGRQDEQKHARVARRDDAGEVHRLLALPGAATATPQQAAVAVQRALNRQSVDASVIALERRYVSIPLNMGIDAVAHRTQQAILKSTALLDRGRCARVRKALEELWCKQYAMLDGFIDRHIRVPQAERFVEEYPTVKLRDIPRCVGGLELLRSLDETGQVLRLLALAHAAGDIRHALFLDTFTGDDGAAQRSSFFNLLSCLARSAVVVVEAGGAAVRYSCECNEDANEPLLFAKTPANSTASNKRVFSVTGGSLPLQLPDAVAALYPEVGTDADDVDLRCVRAAFCAASGEVPLGVLSRAPSVVEPCFRRAASGGRVVSATVPPLQPAGSDDDGSDDDGSDGDDSDDDGSDDDGSDDDGSDDDGSDDDGSDDDGSDDDGSDDDGSDDDGSDDDGSDDDGSDDDGSDDDGSDDDGSDDDGSDDDGSDDDGSDDDGSDDDGWNVDFDSLVPALGQGLAEFGQTISPLRIFEQGETQFVESVWALVAKETACSLTKPLVVCPPVHLNLVCDEALKNCKVGEVPVWLIPHLQRVVQLYPEYELLAKHWEALATMMQSPGSRKEIASLWRVVKKKAVEASLPYVKASLLLLPILVRHHAAGENGDDTFFGQCRTREGYATILAQRAQCNAEFASEGKPNEWVREAGSQPLASIIPNAADRRDFSPRVPCEIVCTSCSRQPASNVELFWTGLLGVAMVAGSFCLPCCAPVVTSAFMMTGLQHVLGSIWQGFHHEEDRRQSLTFGEVALDTFVSVGLGVVTGAADNYLTGVCLRGEVVSKPLLERFVHSVVPAVANLAVQKVASVAVGEVAKAVSFEDDLEQRLRSSLRELAQDDDVRVAVTDFVACGRGGYLTGKLQREAGDAFKDKLQDGAQSLSHSLVQITTARKQHSAAAGVGMVCTSALVSAAWQGWGAGTKLDKAVRAVVKKNEPKCTVKGMAGAQRIGSTRLESVLELVVQHSKILGATTQRDVEPVGERQTIAERLEALCREHADDAAAAASTPAELSEAKKLEAQAWSDATAKVTQVHTARWRDAGAMAAQAKTNEIAQRRREADEQDGQKVPHDNSRKPADPTGDIVEDFLADAVLGTAVGALSSKLLTVLSNGAAAMAMTAATDRVAAVQEKATRALKSGLHALTAAELRAHMRTMRTDNTNSRDSRVSGGSRSFAERNIRHRGFARSRQQLRQSPADVSTVPKAFMEDIKHARVPNEALARVELTSPPADLLTPVGKDRFALLEQLRQSPADVSTVPKAFMEDIKHAPVPNEALARVELTSPPADLLTPVGKDRFALLEQLRQSPADVSTMPKAFMEDIKHARVPNEALARVELTSPPADLLTPVGKDRFALLEQLRQSPADVSTVPKAFMEDIKHAPVPNEALARVELTSPPADLLTPVGKDRFALLEQLRQSPADVSTVPREVMEYIETTEVSITVHGLEFTGFFGLRVGRQLLEESCIMTEFLRSFPPGFDSPPPVRTPQDQVVVSETLWSLVRSKLTDNGISLLSTAAHGVEVYRDMEVPGSLPIFRRLGEALWYADVGRTLYSSFSFDVKECLVNTVAAFGTSYVVSGISSSVRAYVMPLVHTRIFASFLRVGGPALLRTVPRMAFVIAGWTSAPVLVVGSVLLVVVPLDTVRAALGSGVDATVAAGRFIAQAAKHRHDIDDTDCPLIPPLLVYRRQ